ncbi:cell division protein ZipA C-terminal FtsZ-binding domain-containing protein [Acinetobacter towneri]|uniref:cell division protein ZipA C-terminal FtsZ-binding domain-containing protein n=1 Tax=Acinetobacter towneri TaxID=202956 RepID=UPI001F4667F7|nr:cell division protein ZipA C-terminal FtsZ-binding domain-containing protein [Acinetobacter towneri]UIP24664.1 cell division protein ZipA [Acinetobacter towneri]
MEITTIVGIVIAIVIMAFGLKMILKKPTDSAPSLDSELQFNEDCQQPIIPRHVRDQLQSDAKLPRVEPTLIADDVAPEAVTKSEPQALTDDVVASSNTETDKVEPSLQANTKTSELDPSATVSKSEAEQDTPTPTAATSEYSLSDEIQQVIVETAPNAETDEQNKASTEYSLNQHIETAEISEFNEESSILDSHLHEQKIMDEESALATAESFIALNVFPERRILSGDKALKVLMKYGLRFGEMSCFHRYNEDGTKLLFSVLQINDEGADGFDLETLSTEQVKGLAFFLALPHSDVQNAFDTMVSISGLIAREIDGTVYDQNHLEFTPQLREHWRHQAIDYRAGQASHA